MFSRVIVATDLSEASDQVIANLGALNALGTREVILAHVVEIAPAAFSTVGYDYTAALQEDLMRRIELRLAKSKDAVEKQGFRVTSELLSGSPGEALASLAKSSGAKLAIVGSRGASLAKNIVLGSSAAEILRKMPIPVLLKRLEVKDRSGLRHYRLICRDFAQHILFATDFSDTAGRGFQYVVGIVRASHCAVTLFHACPPDASGEKVADARSVLVKLAAKLEAAGANKVRIKITPGKPANEIVRASRDPDISLVVMGTRGKSFVEEFFLGSESQDVIRRASIPLLMIPPAVSDLHPEEAEDLGAASPFSTNIILKSAE